MPKRPFGIPGEGMPLLEVVSLGRRGLHGAGGRLTAEQIDQIRRTVQRAPEVMVKVLGRNSNDLKAAARHLDYIARKGELELETDDGERPQGRVGQSLIEDWDLDIDDTRRQSDLNATNGRKPPKLIHTLVFSMPPGTPPHKVLTAVRNFAREEFALQHRYAFVLHTDEPHPHVHLVLKSMSEQGARLNIRKATLRNWRSEFARNLRLLGVTANATERAVRGENRINKTDGVFRAERRGTSTRVRNRAELTAAELARGNLQPESGNLVLQRTRKDVVGGWRSLTDILTGEGHPEVAAQVRQFVEKIPDPRTEREQIALELSQRGHQQRTELEMTR